MASIRFRIFRIPAEGDAEVIVTNITEAEAEYAAINARYWIAPVGNIGIIAIPKQGA